MHINDLIVRALLGGYDAPGKMFRGEVFQKDASELKATIHQSDFDETFKLVAADLTSTGEQYSKAITAPAAGSSSSFVTLYEATLTPKAAGTLLWAYFLVVVNLVESDVNGDIYWKPQARDSGGTWADLAGWQTVEHDASAAADYRLEGEISWIPSATYENVSDDDILTDLTLVPMDFRVIFYTDHATETAEGKLKNASQIRLVGKVT